MSADIYEIAERRRRILQQIHVAYAGGPCVFCRRESCVPGCVWPQVASESLTAPSVGPAGGAPALWECPRCAFTFDAVHTNEDGSLSCPVCELAALTAPRGVHHPDRRAGAECCSGVRCVAEGGVTLTVEHNGETLHVYERQIRPGIFGAQRIAISDTSVYHWRGGRWILLGLDVGNPQAWAVSRGYAAVEPDHSTEPTR